jgi:hypothetical protein
VERGTVGKDGNEIGKRGRFAFVEFLSYGNLVFVQIRIYAASLLEQ